MQNLGWRKPTPGLVAAEMHAQVGEGLSVPKSTAIIAVKKVAAHIGMKPAQLMLLDILFAFSKPQDWEEGQRAIVWPSNQYLMDQTGFSLPTLKRHLRKLGELGLVAFKDSANGKRFGHRNDEGFIVDACGFDLTPLAARAAAFRELHSKIQTERATTQKLRQKITQTRRAIRATLIEALQQRLDGPWTQLEGEFSGLLEKLPDVQKGQGPLQVIAEHLVSLLKRVESLFAKAFGHTHVCPKPSINKTNTKQNTTPSQLKTDPHIQITNQSPQKYLNEQKTHKSNVSRQPEKGFTFQTFCLACPKFIEMTQEICGQLHSWEDLRNASQRMSLMLGIPHSHWHNISRQIGIYPAAIALGLTFEKHMDDQVHNPAGYLSGMAKKAQTSELHLDRSIFGRLATERKCAI